MTTQRFRRRPSFKRIILLSFLSTFGAIATNESAESRRSPNAVVSLASFGARPNDRVLNSRGPLQQALEELRRMGGGTLTIPAGDYYLDFPDIASDLDRHDPGNRAVFQAKDLKKEKLILVPEGVILQGALGSSGNPATRIHWNATSFPLLSFVNSDNSGAENLAFVFDGVQPQFFPWFQDEFSEAVGYKTGAFGGPYELSTVIYTIGSSHLRFSNLTFESSKKPADNEHSFAFGIVTKGKSPFPVPDPTTFKTLPFGASVPGGGLSECVTGNNFRSLRFQDYVMGIVASGQCNAVFEDIEGDRRGSWYRSFDPSRETGSQIKYIGPPGHLIYLTNQNTYDLKRTQEAPNGTLVYRNTTRNKDVELRNIKEGPETLSNVNSLGTLALKNMDGGLVTNVVSQHPAGLIQGFTDAHRVQLENLSWTADRDICPERRDPGYCATPIIDLEPTPELVGTESNSQLQFKNIKLQSPRCLRAFSVSEETGHLPLSRNITVEGLTIECSPTFAPGQSSPRGIISLRTAGTHLRGVRFIPRIPADALPGQLEIPAIIRPRSTDTSVEITIPGERDRANRSAIFKCVIEGERNQTPVSGTNNECVINGRPGN